MKVLEIFTDHPETVGETYTQHMGTALSFAGPLFAAAFACLIHAFLPFLFKTTGSSIITRLHERMVRSRHRSHGTQADARPT